MRLSPSSIERYLTQGFMVLITASKFMTAPPFAAALIVPAILGARMRAKPMPASGLADYVGKGDWPLGWPYPSAGKRPRPNFGLLLRWVAGLSEITRLLAVLPDAARDVLNRFITALGRHIDHSAACSLIPGVKAHLPGDRVFDDLETILTFSVRAKGVVLGLEDLKNLYRLLNADLGPGLLGQRCHIGQPVALGPICVLRLSAGARLVYDGVSSPAQFEQEILDAKKVIDKIDQLTADWPRWRDHQLSHDEPD
jgi:hypothetical protein